MCVCVYVCMCVMVMIILIILILHFIIIAITITTITITTAFALSCIDTTTGREEGFESGSESNCIFDGAVVVQLDEAAGYSNPPSPNSYTNYNGYPETIIGYAIVNLPR